MPKLKVKPMSDVLSFTEAAALCRQFGLKCNTPRTFYRYVEKHPKVCPVWRRLPGMDQDHYHIRLVARADVIRLIQSELESRRTYTPAKARKP
ncbi:MAG: hypothetical protein KIS67_20195 [Verrucomicrobiae bacterium]|nr:hypothetical protein [Verrucomicrobiae bacterium]